MVWKIGAARHETKFYIKLAFSLPTHKTAVNLFIISCLSAHQFPSGPSFKSTHGCQGQRKKSSKKTFHKTVI